MSGDFASAGTRSLLYYQSWEKDVASVQSIFVAGRALRRAPDRFLTGAPETVDPATLSALRGLRVGDANLGNEHHLPHRVIAAMHEAMRTRRISAVDRYVAHRAYPSPRGIFGADARLVSSAGDQIIISAHADRYPLPYGRLRQSLALLEAGHVAATIGMLLERAGVPHISRLGEDAGKDDDSFGDPAVTIELSSCSSMFGISSTDTVGLPLIIAHPELPLGGWLDLRSSGASLDNLVTSREVTEQSSDRVRSALALALEIVESTSSDFAGIRIHEHWLEDDSMQRQRARRLGTSNPERAMTGDASFASSRGFTFSADLAYWVDVHGTLAQQRLQTTLGWIAQWGCLAAAGSGLTARPARNFDEGSWAEALALGHTESPCYQLWLRQSDAFEPRFSAWSPLGRRL